MRSEPPGRSCACKQHTSSAVTRRRCACFALAHAIGNNTDAEQSEQPRARSAEQSAPRAAVSDVSTRRQLQPARSAAADASPFEIGPSEGSTHSSAQPVCSELSPSQPTVGSMAAASRTYSHSPPHWRSMCKGRSPRWAHTRDRAVLEGKGSGVGGHSGGSLSWSLLSASDSREAARASAACVAQRSEPISRSSAHPRPFRWMKKVHRKSSAPAGSRLGQRAPRRAGRTDAGGSVDLWEIRAPRRAGEVTWFVKRDRLGVGWGRLGHFFYLGQALPVN